jgi:threonine dehydrogenase-like Zn-dependent dehydrogenase
MAFLAVTRPGVVEVCEEPPAPALPEGAFDVRTFYSGVSAGTELSIVRGTNPALTSSWNAELGLFLPGPPVAYPVTKLGYMEVGEVLTTRAPAIRAGALVAMTFGHRDGYRANPLVDRLVVLPDDLDPLLGVFVAHMGPICANGILHAAVEASGTSLADGVRGKRVAITGSGVVALLTALFARRHGASSVVVVESDEPRRAIATSLGLDTLDPGAADPAVVLKTRWRHAPGDRGADVVFQCRGTAESLALALRLLRPQGTVVDLAFYQGGAAEVRLGEEFHHNGLTVRCAQVGRVPRAAAHLWDRDRLSAETVALLHAEGDAIRRSLVTDLVPFPEAPEFFDDLMNRRRRVTQAVFTFAPDG